jgi:transcriptional regulator of arginine metabolism
VTEKKERQTALLELLRRRSSASQQQLAAALNRKGFHATQASVSRDLRELGLLKVNGRYLRADDLTGPGQRRSGGLESELINKVSPVGANLVVIHTPSGLASALAVQLDALGTPDIAGTVAGDDTVFVAVRSRAAQGRVAATLKSLNGNRRPGRA